MFVIPSGRQRSCRGVEGISVPSMSVPQLDTLPVHYPYAATSCFKVSLIGGR